MTDKKPHKGKFIFIPDEGDEAYEIDLETLLEDAQVSFFTKVKNFFTGNKTQDVPLSLSKIDTTTVNVNELVCSKLEELLGSAEWVYKNDSDSLPTCYVVSVSSKEFEDGWEPQIILATKVGSAIHLGFTDLIVNFQPAVQIAPDVNNIKNSN